MKSEGFAHWKYALREFSVRSVSAYLSIHMFEGFGTPKVLSAVFIVSYMHM